MDRERLIKKLSLYLELLEAEIKAEEWLAAENFAGVIKNICKFLGDNHSEGKNKIPMD